MRSAVTTLFIAALPFVSGLGALATVPGLITGVTADASEMRKVSAQCKIGGKYKPVGEYIEMRRHTLYRFIGDCTKGNFGKLCPTVAMNASGKICTDVFFTGDEFSRITVAMAKILVGDSQVPDSILRAASPVVSFSADTIGGNLVIFENGDHIFIASGGFAE